MTLKHKIGNRHRHKTHAAKQKRQHRKINCRHYGSADYGTDGHSRVGRHVLNAKCQTSVGDGEALQECD